MLIAVPIGKTGQKIKDRLVARMKNVRSVTVDRKTGLFVLFVVSVAGDVVSLFQNEYFHAFFGKSACKRHAGKACAGDNGVRRAEFSHTYHFVRTSKYRFG